MESLLLNKNSQPVNIKIPLASSKSESNRALIIRALCAFQGNKETELYNLSTARDTQTMIRLLDASDSTADVLDAGTTMRFLTAFYAATNQQKIMTGTARMCERPIGLLVDALRKIGAEINYLNKEGYPPHEIKGLATQKSDTVTIRGDVSSQYISALLMIAPILHNGLTINLLGEIGSKPYINMTLEQMQYFGINAAVDWDNKTIKIAPQTYQAKSYKIESDWSGASYWYSIVALANDTNTEVELLGLKQNSLQGDSAIVQIMNSLGVKSTFTDNGVLLTKIPTQKTLDWDFSHCPDLAQTVAVCCATLGIEARFTGIESLKIKETDRVLALQNELKKIGADLVETVPNTTYKVISSLSAKELNQLKPTIKTYEDHRMAMAFAPLAMRMDIIIEEPNVVVKSYPSFWEDISKIVEVSVI